MKKPVIGITTGDPAGIGPEVTRLALDSNQLDPAFDYRIIGRLDGAISGKPNPDSAKSAFLALDESVQALRSGEIAAVVTGPIHKYNMHSVGFHFPGQTEFFADRFQTTNYAMLLTCPRLTVALVTAHVPLKDVSSLVTIPEIHRVGALLKDFLKLRSPRPPRIAIAGLNPHAGESGALGNEEIETITPAIEQLRVGHSEAIWTGPISPDTLFHRAIHGEFDGVLCMYHDQGLIPLKMIGFDEGVNVTIGLPVIRTSPDHGTAFEIAGKGIARPDSMIAAIRLAAELAKQKASLP